MSIPADKLPQSPVEKILTQVAQPAAPVAPPAAPAAEAPVAPASEQQAALTGLATQAQQNPYAAHIATLTQQLQATQQLTEQQEGILVDQWVGQLPPQEQDRARAGYQLVRGMRQLAGELQTRDSYIQQMEAGMMPLIKQEVIRRVAQAQKVPIEILQLAEDPRRDLPMLVNLYKAVQSRLSGQTRTDARVDAVPASGSAAPGGGLAASEITARHRGTGNLSAWFAERAKAAR